jgi:hypothetical protein
MCVGTTVAEVAAACRTRWLAVTAVLTLTAIAGSGRRGHW